MPGIPIDVLDKRTAVILQAFGKYFEKWPDHAVVDLQVFLPAFQRWNPAMDQDVLATYIGIIRNIRDDVDDATKLGIMTDLYEVTAATRIAAICNAYNEGELEAPFADLISSVIDGYKINVGARAAQWNDSDISDLLQEDFDHSGLRFRLGCLNECVRPLRPGDALIVAARPDKGKTTLLASEITHMASQLPDDKNVVWLNNEGVSSSIVKRLYQAALGVSITELVKMNNEGRLKEAYAAAVGRADRIRVFDIHGMHVGQVEAILERSNPGVVVYDMIDNVRGFGDAARTDLQLERMYQWAREKAVKYGAVSIAASQISGDGEGLQYPGMSMLKDSRTGKQGACDTIIMLGTSNDANLQHARYISTPKNKLRRDGAPGNPQCEIAFHPLRARMEDIDSGI